MVKAPRLEKLVREIDYSSYSDGCPSIMLFEICSGTLNNNLDKKQIQVIKHRDNVQDILRKYDKTAEVYTTVLFVNGKDIEDHLERIDSTINYILYGIREDVTSSVSEYYSNNESLFSKLQKIQGEIEKIVNREKEVKVKGGKYTKKKGDHGKELEDYISLILNNQIYHISNSEGNPNYQLVKRFRYRKNGDIDVFTVFDKRLIENKNKPLVFKNFESNFGFNYIKKHKHVFMYSKNPAYSKSK